MNAHYLLFDHNLKDISKKANRTDVWKCQYLIPFNLSNSPNVSSVSDAPLSSHHVYEQHLC